MNIRQTASCQAIFATVLLCWMSCLADVPPMPPESPYKPAAGVSKGAGALALTSLASEIPSAITNVTLKWTHSDAGNTNIFFRVYHSSTPSFSSMTLLTNVAGWSFTKQIDRPQEFFGVKTAIRHSSSTETNFIFESDWGGK